MKMQQRFSLILLSTTEGRKNNLLVIEAKKDVKKDPKDERKLTEYKNQLGYQHAYSVTFPTGQKVNDFRESQIDGFITPV